ncbi:MAG: hypothetical protein ACRD2R_07930, partial [Terriglobales bacterium]
MIPGPKLLVSWEPKWRAFTSSLGPALSRTPEVSEYFFLDNQDVPRFLVPWSSRWSNFLASLEPAVSRSAKALATECD